MLRLLLRLTGLVLLACGFATFVVDASRSLAADKLVVTPFEHLASIVAPHSFGSFKALVEARLPDWAWDPVLREIFNLPAFALLGLVALLAFWLGRPPRPKFGYSSR